MARVVVSHIAVARPDRASPDELATVLRALVREDLVAMPAALLIGHVALQSPGFLDPLAPPAGTTVVWRGHDLEDLIDALAHAWLTHDVMVLFHTWSPATHAGVGAALVSLREAREITLFTASDAELDDTRTWDESDPGADDGLDDRYRPGHTEPEDDTPHLPPAQTVQMGMDGNELIFGEGAVGPFFDYVVLEGRDAPRIADLDNTDLTDILAMTLHSRLALCQSEW